MQYYLHASPLAPAESYDRVGSYQPLLVTNDDKENSQIVPEGYK